MIAAYREPDPTQGRELMQRLIESVSQGVPGALREVITLGRTLTKRAADALAYFDRPAPATDRQRRSTAASNTSAAPPSGSATSPTTSPDHSWRPADSDPDYTLHCEEPDWPGIPDREPLPTPKLTRTYDLLRRSGAENPATW
jgi:hypothetical protein